MIVDERMVTFIHSLETENSEILETIEKEALDTYVPIIRKEMQSFLKVLLAIKKPKRILEVGTAVGFSAILMSEYAPEDCHITTIEKYEKRIPIALENFKRAGKEEKITLLDDLNIRGLSIWTISSCCNYYYLLIDNYFKVEKNPN